MPERVRFFAFKEHQILLGKGYTGTISEVEIDSTDQARVQKAA